MKNHFILYSVLLLVNCANDAHFEVPQPEGIREESSLPKKLTGIYRSMQDSTLLHVTEKQMVRFVDRKFQVPVSLIDSAYHIKGDTSFYDAEYKMSVEVIGDSVFGHFRFLDTLFDISPKNVLKKYSGYYFLNREVEPNRWDVFLLSYRKNEVRLISRWSESEVAALREITHGEVNAHDFKPTRAQMREFVKRIGIPDGERFMRLYAGDANLEWFRLTKTEEHLPSKLQPLPLQ